jgi:TrmH family RNA methyltransferase
MISSLSNPKVKEVQKLQKSGKYRHELQKFVVEGWRILKEVPLERFDTIFVLESYRDQLDPYIEEAIFSIEVVTESVLKAMSSELSPQGVLATIKMTSMDKSMISVDEELIIALECVQDPGNLGTILRSADAAGATKVILSKGTVDLYNPKVVKATMGAIFRLEIQTDVDLEPYVESLKSKGIHVFAAHLKGRLTHFEGDYTKGTCFLMGNEGNGLSEALAEKASSYIKIPMREGSESLNVGVATSILLYETLRQRSK